MTTPRRIRAVEYNDNIYFTSNRGILKLQSPTSLIGFSGSPRALDVQLALVVPVGVGIMANNDNYGYRIIWGITDTNNNLVLGAPSQRTTIRNTAGVNRDVSVTFIIPQFITTNHFYQIYRTKVVNGALADPGDEMFLVYEDNPTAAQLVAGTITITDIRPDIIIGEPLYTNATQEGIIQANYQPPLAADIAVFKDTCFLSNITSKQRLFLSLIGMTGFAAGVSTITIGGITYQCVAYAGAYSTQPAGENTVTGVFVYYTAGTVAEQIRGTAESICRVVNRFPGNTQYYGFYISDINDTPGQMLFEERQIGGAAYVATAQATIQLNFEPKLVTGGPVVSSSSDYSAGRLAFSKFQQLEAFPTVNYLNVGARGEAIERTLPLRDSLIVIKQFTIWRVTGTDASNFSVSILDNTIAVNDRYDSAAILNNQVFALSNQGPVAISDTGVQIIGRPEEYQLTFGTVNGDNFSVGIGHEALRIYVLSTFDPEFKKEGDTYPYSCFVYNIVNQSWTRWLINSNCFAVMNDKLFYGLNNTNGNVLEQRQFGFDFYDEEAIATVSLINVTTKTATIVFTPSVDYDTYYSQFGYVDDFGEGWVVVDGFNRYLVTEWDQGASIATFNTVTGLTDGDKSCFRPIPFHIEWMPVFLGNTAELKQDTEVVITGAIDDASYLKIQFTNELDQKKYFFYYSYLNALPESIITEDMDVKVRWNQEIATRFKRARTWVPKSKIIGAQVSIRALNNVAGSRIGYKSVVLGVRGTGSPRSGR